MYSTDVKTVAYVRQVTQVIRTRIDSAYIHTYTYMERRTTTKANIQLR